MALEEGPWFISRNPLILRPWEPSFSFAKDDATIHLRASFPRLSFHLWTEQALNSIASVIGVPLFSDDPTMNQSHLAYAHVCIKVKASDGLPDIIKICDNGRSYDQYVEYDWRPSHCPTCKTFTHSTMQYGKTKPVSKIVWVRKDLKESHSNKAVDGNEESKKVEEIPIFNKVQNSPQETLLPNKDNAQFDKGKNKITIINPFDVLQSLEEEEIQNEAGNQELVHHYDQEQVMKEISSNQRDSSK